MQTASGRSTSSTSVPSKSMKRLASTTSPAGGRGSANGTAFVAMRLSLPDEGEERQGRRLEMGRMPESGGHRLSAPLLFQGTHRENDRKSTRLKSSHSCANRLPSSA